METSSTAFAEGVEGDPVTHGIDIVASAGQLGANNQNSRDGLAIDEGGFAMPSLIYFGGLIAAVHTEDNDANWKVYFMGFGGEAISGHQNNLATREEFLGRVIDWFEGGTVGVEEPPGSVATPKEFVLEQNWPNPFNPVTTIRYSLPRKAHVRVEVFNLMGELVSALVDREQSAGTYSIQWNGMSDGGAPVGGGIYFYRMRAGSKTLTRKMVLIR